MSSTKIAGGDLRRVILDCALQLGDELGETGMTMRKLARRLGVNQALLYSGFEHKAELMRELGDIAVQRLDHWLAEASTHEDPIPCLFDLCIAEAQFARRHPWLYRLAFD